jgi:rubrerythrin
MTVYGDLERAIAMAEASKGSYLLFATDSEDDKAKQVFQDMAEDMERHVTILKSRQDYLEQNNQLNAGGSDKGDKGDKKKKQGGS